MKKAIMRQRLYKLTDTHDRTYGGMQWGPNVTHTAPGTGDLCGPGWIHAYTHQLLAIFLNPIGANYSPYHLWEAVGVVSKTDHGLKVGCTTLTTVQTLSIQCPTIEQCVRFGIASAAVTYRDPAWRTWAAAWVDGQDRTPKAAWAAKAAAWAAWAAWAAEAAAEAAAKAAAEAAKAAKLTQTKFSLIRCAEWAMSESMSLEDSR